MRIERVSVEPLDLPLREPFEIALGTQHAAENVAVFVETENCVVGVGDCNPDPHVTGETREAALATARAAGDLVEGESVADYRTLVSRIRRTFPGMVSATFALETAILDAYCRERELPLSELLGGAPGAVQTDLTIGICEPDEAGRRAARAVTEGFSALKVKVGTDVHRDVERVVAVADEAPGATLTVDANQGWTPKESARFVDRLGERGVTIDLVEQPVPADDVAGLARTRDRLPVPVAADESLFSPADAVRLVREEAADVFTVKLGKSGVLGAADIAGIARAANVDLMVGCMLESAVGIRTSAHVVSGFGGFSHVDLDGNQLLETDVVERDRGPEIPVTGPGHGVDPASVQ
ncbi:dipeptide epimerase [Haloarchaeobius amylolyticus]|uniref:dipeptide epimerase n=1 Tax=Haloarchaeobius amylolyticus TaxID=1198296 RepID=UPI00226E1818|nr:dipeptide epimerase [Haloarchaeobius amylolyticus]